MLVYRKFILRFSSVWVFPLWKRLNLPSFNQQA